MDSGETLLIPRKRLEKFEALAREHIKQAQLRQQRAHARKGGRKMVKIGDLVSVRKRPRDRKDIIVDGPYKVLEISEEDSKIRVEGCPRGDWVALDDAAPYRPRGGSQ
jgi:hypothetical protein